MIFKLFNSLFPSTEKTPDIGLDLALCTLLVRLAKADGTYGMPEVTRISRILEIMFDLPPDAVYDLRIKGEDMEEHSLDMVRFTRIIKKSLPLEQRHIILQALWYVALADRQRDDEEDQQIRQIVPLLGLTDVNSATARRDIIQKTSIFFQSNS